MNQQAMQNQHSGAWVTFTYASFIGSVVMVGIGIVFLPLDVWIKGYLAMGVAMLIQSCITVTKTIRDQHEGTVLLRRPRRGPAEGRPGIHRGDQPREPSPRPARRIRRAHRADRGGGEAADRGPRTRGRAAR